MMSNALKVTAGTTGAGRILVADDEPAMLLCYQRILGAAGYDVETVLNGEEAVAAFENGQYDVVLSDIQMPVMNGLELLRAVRERDHDVPFIFLTADTSGNSAIAAVESRASRYLTKPINSEMLREAVKNAVADCRQDRARRGLATVTSIQDAMSTRFESALDKLWMAFQPIVRCTDKTVFGYEALVRTREPSVPHPGVLLDTAERLGELPRLGRTIRAAVAASLNPADRWAVFVNLHPMDLLDESLYGTSSPLYPFADRVVFEITERQSITNVVEAQALIRSLRQLGYRVAIDDLGAGYAGMSSFAALDPELVKIDMSLVRDIDRNVTAQKVVEALVVLSHNLSAEVIAEGIETEAERDMLVSLGCDLLQGYLFAKPGPYLPTVKF